MGRKLTAAQLAEILNGELKGDGGRIICKVGSLKDKDADAETVSFLGNKKYHSLLDESPVGVVLVGRDVTDAPKKGRTFIICDSVDTCFAKAINIFAPEPPKYEPGIHPSAVVAPGAKLGADAHVGANAVIESGAVIGARSVIGAGVYIGHQVKIGEDCLIYPNVSIRERCLVGNRVIIHLGAAIGSDGYGFLPTSQGIVKLPQVGIVQIDDDVEIGANTTIDRARFGKTWIKRGVKIDNLVQIAHNVVVGEWSMLIAQCGVAGSADIRSGVVVGAQAGVNGHIIVNDGVKIAATSAVLKTVPAGLTMAGTPAESQRELMERLTLPKKVRKLVLRIEKLEAELASRQA